VKATGQSVRTVALESWALTLWTYVQVQEIETIARVHAEGDRIQLASLFAAAVHEPKQLEQRDQEWRQRAQLVLVPTKDEAMERGRRMAQNILARGVLN
jgi:hypothetical protein